VLGACVAVLFTRLKHSWDHLQANVDRGAREKNPPRDSDLAVLLQVPLGYLQAI